jgi:hypothetical protein
VDRVVEREGIRADIAMLQAPLTATWGRYEDRYRLCYVRGPEGIIIELAEHLG